MRTLIVSVVAATALLATACGGTDGETAAAGSDASAPATPTVQPAPTQAPTPPTEPTPEPATTPVPAPTATPTPTPEPPQEATPALSAQNIVPSVEVIDVRSGERIDVQSVVPSSTPVLLWAWAPHCPACRAEAASAQAFAAAHADEVTMVGLGTQDDLAYAEGFLRDTGVTTPAMLWDPSFESWARLGISAQPTWILVDGSGAPIARWVGPLPEDEVLQAARAA